jgi:hypothetical protein
MKHPVYSVGTQPSCSACNSLSSWFGAYIAWNVSLLIFENNSVAVLPTCYRAHAQAAANMQQQHTPGSLPPGMMHPNPHSPLQLQPPGPTQPHVPGLYLGSDVA